MAEISRRTVLTVAGAGVGAVALAGGGYWLGQLNTPSTPTVSGSGGGQAGMEPSTLRSSGGKLSVDLTAAHTHTTVAGQHAQLMTYNGISPGPTLVAKPGDTININFTNKLGEPTNLHTHGLHVSPTGNSDNVFVEIKNGESFQYQYKLDADLPPGVYWYHPHHHGMAAPQVFGGLYGALIVEEPNTVTSNADRILVISDITINKDGSIPAPSHMDQMMGREGATLLLNGQVQPVYESKQGALERWRIINACTSRYLNLSVPGATAHLLGIDAGRFANPALVTNITLAPGNRADLLVTMGSSAAALTYTTVPHADAMGMGATTAYKNYPLATFRSVGATTPATLGALAPVSQPDLRKASVTARRNMSLAMPAMGGGMMGNMNGQFTINGNAFDMNVVNTTVALGTVEEWTLINTSTMDHPFHLHVWPMQVLSVGGKALSDIQYQDVVNVPANGQSIVRISFDRFAGKAVYHCHILDHEDLGMMGIIEAK